MTVIEIKSKIKVGSDYTYGLNMFSIYNYVVALLNQDKINAKQKFNKEDYDIEFALSIKKAEKFGNYSYYTNKTTDRAVCNKDKKLLYGTMLDNPRMFVHLNIIIKDKEKEKLEKSLNLKIDWDDKSSIKIIGNKIKNIPFLGNKPNSIYVKKCENLKQIGGRIVYEEKFDNVEEFLTLLDKGKEKEVFFPTILGYQKIQDLNFKTYKNNTEFNSSLIEPMIGIVGIKSVYLLDEIEDKNYWFNHKADKRYSKITTLVKQDSDFEQEQEILI